MGLDSCMKCLKYTLFIFNFIFWLIGVIILAFGLYLLIHPMIDPKVFSHWPQDFNSHLHTIRLSLIVLGSVIMLLGFLGCCGAILENKCMLVVFFILMTLIFLALVTLGLLVVFMGKSVADQTVKIFNETLIENIEKNDAESRNETDAIQNSFKCCGSNGKNDYETRNKELPKSCYKEDGGKKMPYEVGCSEVLKKGVDKYWLKFIIGLFTSALITLIGMVLAMTLCCALRDDVYD